MPGAWRGARRLSLDNPEGSASGPVHATRRDGCCCVGVRPSCVGRGRSCWAARRWSAAPLRSMLTAADATVTIGTFPHAGSSGRMPAGGDRGGGGWPPRAGAGRLARARSRRDRRGDQPGARRGGWSGMSPIDECAAIAAAITPVPGGVGPMTIACLLENTGSAAVARRDSRARLSSQRRRGESNAFTAADEGDSGLPRAQSQRTLRARTSRSSTGRATRSTASISAESATSLDGETDVTGARCPASRGSAPTSALARATAAMPLGHQASNTATEPQAIWKRT